MSKLSTGKSTRNSQPCSQDDEKKKRLAEAYQRAFLEEADQRRRTNEEIQKLRKTERALNEAARNLSEVNQTFIRGL